MSKSFLVLFFKKEHSFFVGQGGRTGLAGFTEERGEAARAPRRAARVWMLAHGRPKAAPPQLLSRKETGDMIRCEFGYARRSINSCFMAAMAWAGFRPLGQVCVQFMIVWQR